MTNKPTGAPESDPEILSLAEKHFTNAVAVFQDIVDKVKRGEAANPADAERLARSYLSATQTLFNVREKFDNERRRKQGVVHDYALDLDKAREQVCRQLDRLRSAGEAGDVSE